MPTLNFQQMILRLLEYWQEQGCLVWQPYNVQVGAGTMNPATILRVLGPGMERGDLLRENAKNLLGAGQGAQ